jgi:heat shock protein HslJ
MNKLSKPLVIVITTILATLLTIPTGFADTGSATFTDFANATYLGIEEGPVALSDGRWEGEPFVEGGASRPAVGLVKDFQFSGDLDGDGSEETVVFLWQNSGGTGSNVYLAVMSGPDAAARNIATALIGDRVKLRNGHIDSGSIILEVVQAGEDDAMCCPGTLATRTWSLSGQQLEEGEMKMTGRLSAATLDGTEWLLTHMNTDRPVSENVEVTLAFSGDKISGKSACNRYSAGIVGGDNPGEIHIGPSMGTRMACPDELMTAESEYLEALTHVTGFSFHAGSLALTGENNDGTLFNMLFSRLASDTPQAR